MNIDEFNVSEQCWSALKQASCSEVEDIVFFLEEQAKGIGMFSDRGWLQYFNEIVKELKRLGLWSEAMQQIWHDDLFE